VSCPADGDRLSSGPWREIVTVRGRHRLPTDVVGELSEVLAAEPSIVICDVADMAPLVTPVNEAFAPVLPYLRQWPGTVVLLHVSDPAALERFAPVSIGERLLVHTSAEIGLSLARSLLVPSERNTTHLAPLATAAREARDLTTKALLSWRLWRLAGPAGLVVNELVTNAVLHQNTVLELTVTRIGSRIRLAVHDHGGGTPQAKQYLDEDDIHGRGLLIIQRFSQAWGVFPNRGHGKTVWAILDALDVSER
jgi:hypothetical protein